MYDYNGNVVDIPSGTGDVTFSDLNNVLDINHRKQYRGWINSSGKWIYTTQGATLHDYFFCMIEVNGGETVVVKTGQAVLGALTEYDDANRISGNDAQTTSVSATSHNGGLSTYSIADDAKYLLVLLVNNNTVQTIDLLSIDGVNYAVSGREELYKEKKKSQVNWVSFGDSIARSYFSYIDSGGNVVTREDGYTRVWPYKVAQINYWGFQNMAYGGSGWIDDPEPSYLRIREVTDYTQYNLVTFAFGINDWKANRVVGSLTDAFVYADDMTPTTVIAAMRYCFEYIMRRNPLCKIVVITPFNCKWGSADTGWARGCTDYSNPGTLDHFADTMISVCDEYGIEYIDATRYSPINMGNISALLPDGIHPSVEGHTMLARDLATKIHVDGQYNLDETTY